MKEVNKLFKTKGSLEKLPKVLIVNSYAFDKNRGIMNRNLFSGYPKERIAALTYWCSEKEFDRCSEYFYMGNEERRWKFPLNLLSNEKNTGLTGEITSEILGSEEKPYSNEVNVKRRSWLRESFKTAVKKIGLEDRLRSIRLSKRLKEWIYKIDPEIVYAQPDDSKNIRFLLKLRSFMNAKFVIHFMDDWIQAIDNHSLLSQYEKRVLERDVRKLLRSCDVNIAISTSMAKDYSERYGVQFEYIHNPLNDNLLARILQTRRKHDDEFVVAYYGRIGMGNSSSIVDVAECVQNLSKNGKNIRMVVYTASDVNVEYIRSLEKLGVQFVKDIDNSAVEKMREVADLLLYSVDFDENSIAYLRHSMPTKLPLYLASGLPILCYGPDQVKVIELLNESRLVFAVTVRDQEILKQEMLKIYRGHPQLFEMLNRARNYAIQHFDETAIRKKFLNLLTQDISPNVLLNQNRINANN